MTADVAVGPAAVTVVVGEAIAADDTVGPVAGCCTAPLVELLASELFTISCFVSEDRVPGPGFVRLIFIFKPGSTVAE